jgi:hypothetical protein
MSTISASDYRAFPEMAEKPVEQSQIDWKKVAIITAIAIVAVASIALIVASAVATCGGSLAIFGGLAAFLGSSAALGVGIGGVTAASVAAIGLACFNRSNRAAPSVKEDIAYEPESPRAAPSIGEKIARLKEPFIKEHQLKAEEDENPIYRASSRIIMPQIEEGELRGGFSRQFHSMNYSIQDVELVHGDSVGNFTKIAAKLGLTADQASALTEQDPRFHALYVLAGQADCLSQDEMRDIAMTGHIPQIEVGSQTVQVLRSDEDHASSKVSARYLIKNFTTNEVVSTLNLEQTVSFERFDPLPRITYSRKVVD